jgi:hypothetical protein
MVIQWYIVSIRPHSLAVDVLQCIRPEKKYPIDIMGDCKLRQNGGTLVASRKKGIHEYIYTQYIFDTPVGGKQNTPTIVHACRKRRQKWT